MCPKFGGRLASPIFYPGHGTRVLRLTPEAKNRCDRPQVGPLLLALGQPPEIAQMAARYLLLAIPALPIMAIRETVTRYLLTQRVATPGLVVNTAAAALAPLYSYLLLFR